MKKLKICLLYTSGKITTRHRGKLSGYIESIGNSFVYSLREGDCLPEYHASGRIDYYC